MPLLMALCVVIGIVIGTFYANHFSGNRLNIINSGSNRLNNLLHIIDDQYVDTVNINDLVEKAIPQILSELDPHSAYISAKDAQNAADDLKGSFFGVGIEFSIEEDTIHVQNVIALIFSHAIVCIALVDDILADRDALIADVNAVGA